MSAARIQLLRANTSRARRSASYRFVSFGRALYARWSGRPGASLLMVIASSMLRYDLEDKKRTFFNFRHTGASHIAQRGKTPAHLLAVVQMMGDTSVATVNRRYFNMEPELMRELVLGWKRPDVDVPSVAATDLFGADHARICDMELPLAS